ncbi:putative thiamine transport system substrate-binding protein [Modicisalibacter ilicicola DSM 19980]|uniref:Putative thiamine transport system substrate-binding protein n=1 Tax=Modicisalibacter ilicicola DSM 19980 TaxID=1121942 RepID=A0A1M4ZVA7_9GAMM|nr:ABC transporter substrate-binding protein [Halomonas ilicicola]SHF21905.1 putative thiamine transport system substrate-binding protein [Halomonas ilicicola DSM 19980]
MPRPSAFRVVMASLTTMLAGVFSLQAQALELDDWSSVEAKARGQTVYFNAWGGDSRINGYIDWVAQQVQSRHDIELVHVKLGDTAEAVSRIVAEKSAGNLERGAIDLIWINGENFAALKEAGLLHGPWAEQLPNFSLTAPEANPEVRSDFTLPVEGLEAPWGKAQITFYYDSARVETPPRSMQALLDWARNHPGRFTYPLIPDFLGSTFLKQALLSLAENRGPLYGPVSEADFASITAPLWDYLDALHPHLWRGGRSFPNSSARLRQLMGDGELSLAFTFTPSEPAASVANYQLPPTTRSYMFDDGTLGNVHFLAIPFNARHKAGALVVANFLLSPQAQARKQDITVWGDATVLAMEALTDRQRQAFESLPENPATLAPEALGRTLPEPHPSWMERLEQAWLERYGAR